MANLIYFKLPSVTITIQKLMDRHHFGNPSKAQPEIQPQKPYTNIKAKDNIQALMEH